MCISRLSSFKEQFPKNHMPEITELEGFWEDTVDNTAALFRSFAEYVRKHYDLRFGIPTWSEKYGWVYRIGKSGVYLIKGIRIDKKGFIVDGIEVTDEMSYSRLLEHVESLYEQNKEEFQKKIADINAKQAQRNKERMKREREELTAIQDRMIPEKYNVFHWPSKLDVHKLKRLYMLDAKGIWDEVLADEIGLTLYLRCRYGKEDMERMEKSIIRCHNCGRELGGEDDFRQCGCGYQYSYKEYRRSFRRNNMPTGSAARIFEEFMRKWERAEDYSEKMILIDTLLHQFHLSFVSGTVNRPAAMNFLDGTRQQVERIINELAVK